MNTYVVWFPKVRRFVGKRGILEESPERAVMFWRMSEAREWADVLGGEVHLYEEDIDGPSPGQVEEPF